MRCPLSNRFAARAQLLGEIRTHRARALAFHVRDDSGLELETLERRQPQLPPRRGAIHHIRFWGKMNNGFAGNAIPTAIMKDNRIMPNYRQKILAKFFACYAAHLEDIHEIGFIGQLNIELKLMEVEILKRKIIK